MFLKHHRKICRETRHGWSPGWEMPIEIGDLFGV
jgi:hypothetical protein